MTSTVEQSSGADGRSYRRASAGPLTGDVVLGERQGWWFLPTFVIGWFASALVYGALIGAALPKLLTLMDVDSGTNFKDARLALLSACGGVVVMIATPLFGMLSDRTMSRWGIRKPWIAGGLAVGTLGVAVLAMSSTVAGLVAGWVIVQLGYGAVQMAQHALLADQVPARIRARVTGATGVASGVAAAAAVALVAALPAEQRWTWFVVPGAVGIVCVGVQLIGFRDFVRGAAAPQLRVRDLFASFWLDPRIYRDFAWAWVSRFCMTLAVLTVSLYLFFIVVDVLGYSPHDAGTVQTQAVVYFLVGSIVAAVACGWVSDRIGRRKPIVWAAGLLTAVGIAIMMLTGTPDGLILGITVAGIGQGAYIAVDVALMTEVLPCRADAGKDLGIVALSYQLPQILGPIIAAVLLFFSSGDYEALYLFAIVCSLVGGLAIIPIRGVR